MKRHTICTDGFEIRYTRPTSYTPDDIWDYYENHYSSHASTEIAAFDTLEEAREAFRFYRRWASTSLRSGSGSSEYLDVTLVMLWEEDWDGDDYDQGEILDWSAEGYSGDDAAQE